MATDPGSVPGSVQAKVGDALSGWKHLTDSAARRLPTNLHRANLIRRGAVAMLAGRKGKGA